MKMVMIVYNEAIEDEVMAALETCRMRNYTKVSGVYGRGTSSGVHAGSDVWPGRNNLLYIACDAAQAGKILACVRHLRMEFGLEGVKGFLLPLEEIV